MKINRENYPAFFLDYHEGILTESQTGVLLNFLSKNPDLQQVFDSFDIIPVQPSSQVILRDKEIIKKFCLEEQAYNTVLFDTFCIKLMEGDLGPTEEKLFRTHLENNPEGRKICALFFKTKLDADSTIQYVKKGTLKKSFAETSAISSVLRTSIISFKKNLLNKSESQKKPEFPASDHEADKTLQQHKKQRPWSSLKIVPARKISHTKHSGLHHVGKLWYYAAAALIPLLITLYHILPQRDNLLQITQIQTNRDVSSDKSKEPVPNLAEDAVIVHESMKTHIAPNLTEITTSDIAYMPGLVPTTGISEFQQKITLLTPLSNIDLISGIPGPTIIIASNLIVTTTQGKNHTTQTISDDSNAIANSARELPFLANIVLTGFERITGLEIHAPLIVRIPDELSLWDLAGEGLAGISSITGKQLSINKQVDENGRIYHIEVGEKIRITR